MAPGNPPPANGTPRGAGAPQRRSVRPGTGQTGGAQPAGRPTGAGRPDASSGPWAPTGAARPAARTGSGTSSGAASGGAAGGRRAAGSGGGGGGGRGGSSGGRGGGGGRGGSGRSRGGRRRLIDYPREGRTGFARWVPSWRLVLGAFLTVLALIVAAFVVLYATTSVPTPDDFARAQTTTVYFADNETEMGTFSEQNRVLVDGDVIPQHVKDAVVAAEDRSFYENPGVDPTGIVRALWNNVRGGDQQGGSSITQQYAERYYYGTTVTDYSGKLREAMLAIKLDRRQDKDEILANYLNTIYWGRDSYGIETAAQSYFGVGAEELDVSQAALLAGIIPSPNNWDPRNDPERAEQRWNYVLDGMVTTGALTQAERDDLTYPETVEFARSDTLGGTNGYLLDMVRRELFEKSPIDERELLQDGYRIVTTIDPDMQDAAVEAVDVLPDDAPENLRTALVTLDPADGAIRALYGGPDFVERSRNAVTQDEAQAGSTFKPFTLIGYLEEGNSLKSRYNGNSNLEVEGFERPVGNFAGQNFGNVDVTKATASSINTVYAQMNAEIGPEKTLEVATRAGVPEDATGMEPFVSNVLGTASPHPIDMAQAFNTFAAQGVRTEPHIVESVEYLDGGLVYEGGDDGERVFEEDIMADTTYALTQVVEQGSGSAARELGRPVAGKTGTSSDNRSAWFIGYTPQLTTAVAMYQVSDDGTTEEEITPFGGLAQVTGGSFPADVWTAFMLPAMEGMEVEQFPERADVGEPNVLEVPNVVGRSEADAIAILEDAGFQVSVDSAPSSDVEEGNVASMSPTGIVNAGITVTIVVSEGPEMVDVPDVVGMSEGAARSALEDAGFSVDVSEEESPDDPGTVIRQSPSGGEEESGSTVSIIVSTGPPEQEETPDPGDEEGGDEDDGNPGDEDEPGDPGGGGGSDNPGGPDENP